MQRADPVSLIGPPDMSSMHTIMSPCRTPSREFHRRTTGRSSGLLHRSSHALPTVCPSPSPHARSPQSSVPGPRPPSGTPGTRLQQLLHGPPAAPPEPRSPVTWEYPSSRSHRMHSNCWATSWVRWCGLPAHLLAVPGGRHPTPATPITMAASYFSASSSNPSARVVAGTLPGTVDTLDLHGEHRFRPCEVEAPFPGGVEPVPGQLRGRYPQVCTPRPPRGWGASPDELPGGRGISCPWGRHRCRQ